MDLQVYAVIAIVFLVSLCSLLFINKQLRGGKTFEDVLAEKRQFAEKLYGNTGGKNFNKKNAKKLNTNNSKKNKERSNNKKNQEKNILSSENDAPSESGSCDESSPAPDNKLHVEFLAAEIITTEDNTVTKKQLSTGKRGQQQPARKNSSSKPPGSSILLNKNEQSRPSLPYVAVELNHFEEIQPKDDLEIRKHRDESTSAPAPAISKKEQRKAAASQKINNNNSNNNNNKKDLPKVVEKQVVDVTDHQQVAVAVNEIVTAAAVSVQKESPKNQANKDKQNKKKKTDAILVQKLIDAGVASTTTDDVNVNVILQFLGRSELTRSEIQILIDFLLNKQQDTANVTNCDWSDDIMQKLRRQLEEKDRQLAEEQSASIALQTKLRELRAEFNNERILNHQRANSSVERCNALTEELTIIQQDFQASTERFANEKKALEYQFKQQQAKLYQEKQLQGQENQKLQVLVESNGTVTAELVASKQIIDDMQKKFVHIHDDNIKKLAEYEQKFQEYVRQSENDVAHLTAENQRLRAECTRKDEYEKLFAIQKFDLEQLEARMAEQSKANNHLDDASKVEIRNLQNALDSTKAELSLTRKDVTESNKLVNDLTAQLNELKRAQESNIQASQEQHAKQVEEFIASIKSYQSLIVEKDGKIAEFKIKLEDLSSNQREKELFEELAVYKAKNNDLRQKNWKLVDALRTAEDKASKSSSSNHSNVVVNNHNDTVVAALTAEQARTREILERLFPNAAIKTSALICNVEDYSEWLNIFTSNIDSQLDNSSVHSSNNKEVVKNHRDNGTTDGAVDDSVRQTTEELILQNAKLKTTVDEYKTIVAETESVLTNLEKKVKEQDSYWRNIVGSKDVEIQNLKQNPGAVNSIVSSQY